jgi:hypothetical protein
VGGIHANNTYPAEFIYDNLMIECQRRPRPGAGVQQAAVPGLVLHLPAPGRSRWREDAC